MTRAFKSALVGQKTSPPRCPPATGPQMSMIAGRPAITNSISNSPPAAPFRPSEAHLPFKWEMAPAVELMKKALARDEPVLNFPGLISASICALGAAVGSARIVDGRLNHAPEAHRARLIVASTAALRGGISCRRRLGCADVCQA